MAKKIRDESQALDQEEVKRNRKFGKNQGIANKKLKEPKPTLEAAGSEKIEAGHNNTYIIQGRDRPSSLQSGYGGKGATGAGRIDLIAGLASSYRHKDGTFGQPNKETLVNPNFAMDAARVYISQKADIDQYMGLAPIEGESTEGRSAIGLKADQIRIHSREDIKLVTGRARIDGAGSDGERLSNGGENKTTKNNGKISFIAGNYTEDEQYFSFNVLEANKGATRTRKKLQPVPKGENLVMCLNEIVDTLTYLTVCIGNNNMAVRQLNTAFMAHVHGVAGVATVPVHSGLPQGVTIQSILGTQAADLGFYKNGLGMIKNTYLNEHDDEVKGALYINSNFVYTT